MRHEGHKDLKRSVQPYREYGSCSTTLHVQQNNMCNEGLLHQQHVQQHVHQHDMLQYSAHQGDGAQVTGLRGAGETRLG